ncbi:hypothetical protein A0H81_08670 [Grifola frondosa]|uniref:Uncharacterized protein n=1 Tax=Grifola frondosa TaxID=5627 RepID=A0A1C7M312_GRIFR|nr:hypothetical protein A0H81_08670 [Grifola frondosa]
METPAEAPRDSQPASVPEALLLSGTLNFQAKWATMPTPGTRLMPKQRMILATLFLLPTRGCATPPPVVDQPPPIGLCDLALPIFVVEYKKPDDETTKGHPVFCLVTAGKAGGILLAWRSVHSEKIFITVRGTFARIELSQPYEALQFAIFLLRLQKWKESLMDKLAGFSVADFVKKAGDGELEWTKTIQVTSMAKAKGQAEAKAKGKAVAKAKGKSGDATLST